MQYQGAQEDLNKKWAGQTLYNQSVLREFQNDFWSFSLTEAKSYCRSEQQCQELIRRMMGELAHEYAGNPLPRDVYSEIIVRLGLLYGKTGGSTAAGKDSDTRDKSGYSSFAGTDQSYGRPGGTSRTYPAGGYTGSGSAGAYSERTPYGQAGGGRSYTGAAPKTDPAGYSYNPSYPGAGGYSADSYFAGGRTSTPDYRAQSYSAPASADSFRRTERGWNPSGSDAPYQSGYTRNTDAVPGDIYTAGSSHPGATDWSQPSRQDPLRGQEMGIPGTAASGVRGSGAGQQTGPASVPGAVPQQMPASEPVQEQPVTAAAGNIAAQTQSAQAAGDNTIQAEGQAMPAQGQGVSAAAGTIPVQAQPAPVAAGAIPVQTQPYVSYIQQVPIQPGMQMGQTVVQAGMPLGQIPVQTISVQPVMQIPVQPVLQTPIQTTVPQGQVRQQVSGAPVNTEGVQELLGMTGNVDSPEAQAVIAQAAQLIQAYNAANRVPGEEEEESEQVEQVKDEPVEADPSKAAGWRPPKLGLSRSAKPKAKEKPAKTQTVKTTPAKAETVKPASMTKKTDNDEAEGSSTFSMINTVLVILTIASVSFLIWETGLIQRFL